MLDEKLIAAYRATDYVLLEPGRGEPGSQEIVLNIGRSSPAFDRVLEEHGAMSAVIVTAYNPRSVVLSDHENRARHRQLMALIESKGYDYAVGEGRDPTGHWKAETECVVFGIACETGLDLARAFDQNAIVFVERGGSAELFYPD